MDILQVATTLTDLLQVFTDFHTIEQQIILQLRDVF